MENGFDRDFEEHSSKMKKVGVLVAVINFVVAGVIVAAIAFGIKACNDAGGIGTIAGNIAGDFEESKKGKSDGN